MLVAAPSRAQLRAGAGATSLCTADVQHRLAEGSLHDREAEGAAVPRHPPRPRRRGGVRTAPKRPAATARSRSPATSAPRPRRSRPPLRWRSRSGVAASAPPMPSSPRGRRGPPHDGQLQPLRLLARGRQRLRTRAVTGLGAGGLPHRVAEAAQDHRGGQGRTHSSSSSLGTVGLLGFGLAVGGPPPRGTPSATGANSRRSGRRRPRVAAARLDRLGLGSAGGHAPRHGAERRADRYRRAFTGSSRRRAASARRSNAGSVPCEILNTRTTP